MRSTWVVGRTASAAASSLVGFSASAATNGDSRLYGARRRVALALQQDSLVPAALAKPVPVQMSGQFRAPHCWHRTRRGRPVMTWSWSNSRLSAARCSGRGRAQCRSSPGEGRRGPGVPGGCRRRVSPAQAQRGQRPPWPDRHRSGQRHLAGCGLAGGSVCLATREALHADSPSVSAGRPFPCGLTGVGRWPRRDRSAYSLGGRQANPPAGRDRGVCVWRSRPSQRSAGPAP